MPSRFWRFFYLGPGSPFPVANRLLISFLRPEARALQGPSHLAQNSPHMPGMIVHLGHRFDQLCYSWQCPQVGRITLRLCPLEELCTDLLNLLFGQPPSAACPRGALDCRSVSVEPIVIPTTDALTAYSQGCGNGSLPFSFAEQGDCFFPSFPEPLKPSDSPLHKASIQPKTTSVTILCETQ